MRLKPFLLLLLGGLSTVAAEVSYNREVLPLLASKCLACHGTDAAKRKAKLRLDEKEVAYAERDGVRAIVAGNPEESELIRRIFSKDGEEVMPPPGEGKALTESEKELLKQWISEGGRYERHWAFKTPVKSEVPDPGERGVNEIDAFVHEEVSKAGFQPQQEAVKEELIRRVSIDLTGLPPTTGEVEAFLSDQSEQAYAKVVDRLLASPRYGERMAAWWLDGARYGDSHGYDNDLENAQWPWRNWVIESFNSNQPYDQFVTWQLAGDLLPDASDDQIVATGFNRNHRIQTEGGAIEEEWRTEYVMDRVETMGSVFLGLTLSCARCHDHKYDPISQKEFYQLFAMFDGPNEKGFINNLRGSAEPRHRYRQSEFEAAVKKLETEIPDAKARGGKVKDLEARHPHVMVMRDEVDRKAFVLKRGQYDSKEEEVLPGLPQAFSPTPQGDNLTRLDLAKWMVDGNHPLTARVFVNRIWEQFFGAGIVKSSENLGRQSDWPSHPELLDWLAVEFVKSRWSRKDLVRLILNSETYRQSSVRSIEHHDLDPANRLLARMSRFRHSAEQIRDNALAVSGLLVPAIGGPPVFPAQPAGLYEETGQNEPGNSNFTWKDSSGDGRYRKSMYTYWKRMLLHPSLASFDAPPRQVCVARRSITNTPRQALVTLNDPIFHECAQAFARRITREHPRAEARLEFAFQQCLGRAPDPDEQKKFLEFANREGEEAWISVATVLLNLDETLTRE